MENKKEVDVIFCGLVRNIDMFKKSIKELVSLRKEGLVNKIILSTWKGEVEKAPEMTQFIKKNKIIVIKTPQLDDNGDGNIWCQMKTLEVGLKKSSKNRFVLKTRTDAHIEKKFLKRLFSSKEKLLKITKNLPHGNIFRYKVWVPWFELTRPFYMEDACFFGHYHDVSLLYNYETAYDTKYCLSGDRAHTRRFIHPFLESNPILYLSMGKYAKEKMLKTFLINHFRKLYNKIGNLSEKGGIFALIRKRAEKNKFSLLHKRLKDVNFIRCLAAYYSILYSHFYIDSLSFKDQVSFRWYSTPRFKSDDLEIDNFYNEDKVIVKGSGQIYLYDMAFINNICEKKIKHTPLGERLTKEVENFNKGLF